MSGLAQRIAACALALAATVGLGQAAHAAATAGASQPSQCQAIAERLPGARYARIGVPAIGRPVTPAAIGAGTGAPDQSVAITFVGHATFRIVSPGGVVIETDFNGTTGDGPVPTVVTMNHAHGSHYTDTPDPRIEHVLRGWNPDGDGAARWHVTVGDVLIRNVTTDIRRWGTVEPDGNSIFIFETAGLCIGHLGHLHQLLTDDQYAGIGRLDVVMVPVDGSYTMSQDAMAQVVKRLRASIVLPMHYFSEDRLARFLARMRDSMAIDRHTDPTIRVSLASLPSEPTVVVLPGS